MLEIILNLLLVSLLVLAAMWMLYLKEGEKIKQWKADAAIIISIVLAFYGLFQLLLALVKFIYTLKFLIPN